VPEGADRHGAPVLAQEPALRTLIARGAMWSMSGYGGGQILRFAGNLILTRLLFPEAFGLMSLVNTVLLGLLLFSDIGVGPSIIQSRRGDEPDFLNTAWTMQIVRGVLLWLAACAVAQPFADFYGDPQLAWILPISGLTALVAGFNSTRIHSLSRRVELKRVAALELGSQAVGLAVMIGWALLDRSIWALVAGGMMGNVAKLVMSHTVLPGIRNRLRWDRTAFVSLVRFGRWIFLSTVLTFLVSQSDRLIFGKLIPIAMLGVYGVGATIATMPSAALAHVVSSVLFPVFSRVHHSDRDLAEVFARVRRPVLVLAGWMIAGLVAGGGVIVHLAYDQRYAEAGWIVQLLAIGSWFAVLQSTNGSVLLARGQANWTAAVGVGKLVGMLALIPVGWHVGGFAGAVLGLGLSEVVSYAVSAYAVSRAGLRSWPADLRLSAWLLATAWAGWSVAEFVSGAGFPLVVAACAVFVSIGVLWTPSALSTWRARHADATSTA
jgi:O-antigen/teichoic acid export membrane protein